MTPPYTDTQLKQALAKMLPDKIWIRRLTDIEGLYWKDEAHFWPVLDTELLHLCWLVEETLMDTYSDYYEYLAATTHSVYRDAALCHATWQQRVIALCKVKGVEIA